MHASVWILFLSLSLSLGIGAVRHLKENQSSKNAQERPLRSEQNNRRRSKSNVSVDNHGIAKVGRRPALEDYDFIDVKYSSEVIDSFETSLESVKRQQRKEGITTATTEHDIFTCCNQVFGSCRTACENISLDEITHNSEVARLELRKYCEAHHEFWTCVNSTLDAVLHGSDWSGRRCCQFGVLLHCRNACASSSSAPVKSCRRSDEQVLYDCFERQEAADLCCSQARTSQCLQACHGVFEPSSSSQERVDIDSACGARNTDVVQCIHNHTDMTPLVNAEQYLPCCEFSSKEHCRHICRNLLQQNSTSLERSEVIFSHLEAAGCGTPLPHLPFWQCFLTINRKLVVPTRGQTQRNEGSNVYGEPNELGMDAAKRQCCEQASSHKCRRLCMQIFTNNWWDSRASFEIECLEQPGERELRRCIENVDNPCELGCDGLSFCTNFNNRPTELFRSCSASYDAAAREDLQLLQQRGYVKVLGQELFIKNTTLCAPEKWKALVCALQIQPCTREGHFNGICSEDCSEILEECLDWTRQQQKPQAICSRLQPSLSEDETPLPCISLKAYLQNDDISLTTSGHPGLTSPCLRKPCNSSEVCVLERSGAQGYACIPGCSMGQASNFLVPFGSYVRLGKTSSAKIEVGQFVTAEHVVCRCGLQGQLEQCQPLPSYTHSHCVLPGGRSFRHGSSFYLECNLCSCFAGEITCTKQQCRLPGFTEVGYTSLPCNCATHYVAVCGSNGNTYPSACVAKCLGLQESMYIYGACNSRNACHAAGTNACGPSERCLEKRQVCLSNMQKPCLQYICVNATASNCYSQNTEQLCDVLGNTHSNACEFVQAQPNDQVAYWGACQLDKDPSSSFSSVCGINGVTYRSAAAARTDYVLVDYTGRCREVGLLVSDMGRRCRTVKCPSSDFKYCHLIVPPGACCPLCAGGALRIIYSKKQLDRATYALKGKKSSLLTLRGVLQQLDSLIQINECQLTGFLTMEVGIFVALVPKTRGSPTRLQLEACGREAEKISALINAQSPSITTNLVLSSLTVSHLLQPLSSGGWVQGPLIWLKITTMFLGLKII
ncbi:reversion-inducing cysteine-rich protein with Kazal motifs [Drosophila willistoni]|uniref:reversion-inducing cysteine-rich protein with Kazal motifs n=1 Tax=Drosophila willistoni TaxID=7260 RepID=UPI00017D9940|nr:reversion-inducing cysteine-rich protein with Kazal motifs [Drosophila willistoni]